MELSDWGSALRGELARCGEIRRVDFLGHIARQCHFMLQLTFRNILLRFCFLLFVGFDVGGTRQERCRWLRSGRQSWTELRGSWRRSGRQSWTELRGSWRTPRGGSGTLAATADFLSSGRQKKGILLQFVLMITTESGPYFFSWQMRLGFFSRREHIVVLEWCLSEGGSIALFNALRSTSSVDPIIVKQLTP